MSTDIICAEGELSKAVNQIGEYSDFLVRTIRAYKKIVEEIQNQGIQDELINKKLAEMMVLLNPLEHLLITENSFISIKIGKYITSIEQADQFIFPADVTSSVMSILSYFL